MNIEDLKCCGNCDANGSKIGAMNTSCLRLNIRIRVDGCCEHWQWDKMTHKVRNFETST